MSKSLVALVLLTGCVKHFDIDTVYREKRVEGTYIVLQDQYGGCAVTFRARHVLCSYEEYPIDKDVYDALEREWCDE